VGISKDHGVLPNYSVGELVEKYQHLKSRMENDEIPEEEWRVPDDIDAEQFPFGLVDEDPWQEDKIPKPLLPIFHSLSCEICRGYYDNAVCIKPCGHTLCSLCIREQCQKTTVGVHRRKNACSVCNHEIGDRVDKHLVKNRPIQEAVLVFQRLVKSLEKQSETSNVDEPEEQRQRSSHRNASTNVTSALGQRQDDDVDEQLIITRLPARNYDRTKPKELKDICLKYNLSIAGKDDEIRDRLKRFTVLWNAELDSIDPKKPSDLVRRINKEERDKAAAISQELYNGTKNQSILMRNLHSAIDHKKGFAGSNISTGNEQFDKIVKNNFSNLVAQMKKKREWNKRKFSNPDGEDKSSRQEGNEEALNDDVGETNVAANSGELTLGESKQVATRQGETNVMVNTNAAPRCDDAQACVQAATRIEQPYPHGQTQEDAIEIDDDSDCNDAETVGGKRDAKGGDKSSLQINFDSKNMNKENNSHSSPHGSQQHVSSQQPTAESKQTLVRNPYAKKPNKPHASTSSSCNSVSVSDQSTPAAKRPSPSDSDVSSEEKRIKSPWSCPHCTYQNDGSMQGVCLMCGKLRKGPPRKTK
jgi:hypothetical protein